MCSIYLVIPIGAPEELVYFNGFQAAMFITLPFLSLFNSQSVLLLVLKIMNSVDL